MRKEVCIIEGSEKLKGVITTISVNKVSNTGDFWIELLNCNDTDRKYQNIYVTDLQDWSSNSGLGAILEGKTEFSEVEMQIRKKIFREHLSNANYKEHLETVSEVLAEFGDIVALTVDIRTD